jgi:hypothetical protein
VSRVSTTDDVSEDVDFGGYKYTCPDALRNSRTGEVVRECGFVSYGHEHKSEAVTRGKEHEDEHATGEPMREIIDFVERTEV